MSKLSTPELVIVTPAFNESVIIEQFVKDWSAYIRSLNISFEFRIYDDSSTDKTAEIIEHMLPIYPELRYHLEMNSGHGPTITKAYQQSLDSKWIFQIDSDHELPVDVFGELWNSRSSYDLLMGVRTNRDAPFFRRALTKIATITVGLFFGKGPSDINIPYRLIRAEKLLEFLPVNRPSNFAPNVLMTAFAIKNKWRIKTLPVTHNARKKINGSGFSLYMLKGACNSIWQLLKLLQKEKNI